MNNFSFSTTLKLAWFSMKLNRKQIIGWCISIFLIMFLYMILFPSVKDMAQVKIDAMPKELLAFAGMDKLSDMSNFITYFGMIFNMILVAISIFAASFGANLIAKEEKSKTIEFLYSLEISRNEVYVSKLIAGFFAILVVVCSGTISSAIAGAINGGETFVVVEFIQIVKVSGFIPFFFLAIAFMISGISTKIGGSMIASMMVLATYVFGFLSGLLGDKAEWMKELSPFELFSPQNAIALESHTIYEIFIYFALSICFLVIGGIWYKRRDFNI